MNEVVQVVPQAVAAVAPTPMMMLQMAVQQGASVEQLEQAIRKLGSHWVLHPQNRVAKLAEPLPEVFRWAPKVLPQKKAKK